MQARIVDTDSHRITVQIEVDMDSCRTLADCEEEIQRALNEAGIIATAEALKQFDVDGQPIDRDGRRYTTKGRVLKRYETPYGVAGVERHVYQHSGGGATYCPLDERAGIVLSATPKFARMIASKYAEFGSARVQEDMAENHGRAFSRGLVAHLAEAVAAVAEFETAQTIYRLPEFDGPITALVVALDEIAITTSGQGPAKAAIGSIGFYDEHNQRRYMIYLADLLESGTPPHPDGSDPGRFLDRIDRELRRAEGTLVDGGPVVGISGGQAWCARFLQGRTTTQFIDPSKVIDLLSSAAQAHFGRDEAPDGEQEDRGRPTRRSRREIPSWIRQARDRLRSDGGVISILGELDSWLADHRPDEDRETISRTWEFLAHEDDSGRLNYRDPFATLVWANAGILADSTRAMFGDRLRHPKFKIGLGAAKAILILRELTRTPGRWAEFWSRITGKDVVPGRPES